MQTIIIYDMHSKIPLKLVCVLTLGAALAALAFAVSAATPEYKLTIRQHSFQPSTLTIPANTKVRIHVTNEDPTPSEFESSDFNREKIVLPKRSIVVFVGPLPKGRYHFFDDFHQDTGQGVLVVE